MASHMVTKTNAQVKRLRKAKSQAPIEKDRTRGRYACLGHRMKHKRCPLDCPERRPKPNQEETVLEVVSKHPRLPRTHSTAKKNVIQLEECTIGKNQLIMRDFSPQIATSNVERDVNWDSVEWEGLGWDNEHVVLKDEAWMDLKSSSHWEESKYRETLIPEDSKPTDDLTKYEEEEIIDSWLNEDGFGNSEMEAGESNDSLEGNSSETGSQRRPSIYSSVEHLANILPKILLTRDMLERWLCEPYFNGLVQGCFVRVKVGEYMDTPLYRIAHIDEVQDSCFFSYRLNQSQTTKGLALQIGSGNRRIYKIQEISNQPPTESDLRIWQEEMEKSNICLDPVEVEEKQEIVRVLDIKYPEFPGGPQDVEPMINEPIWHC